MRVPVLLLAALLCWPAVARAAPPRERSVLFVGNSFTHCALSPARNWNAAAVSDLNGTGYGGVPALFRRFSEEAGRPWSVSLETENGQTLGFHYDQRRSLIDRSWDAVVLQEYSTLSPVRPGDDADYRRNVRRLSALFRARNARVAVWLLATWTRADQLRLAGGRWYGQPVAAMALDLRAAADRALAGAPGLAGVIPVGEAWNRAIAAGVADPDPYDGIAPGRLNLWAWDHYHAGVAGCYLDALVVWGRLTGLDPATLGGAETAADELGLSETQAAALQRVARDELAAPRNRVR